MTGFVVIAALLLGISLLWILPALLRRNDANTGIATNASNLAILRDQLVELDRDVGNGILSAQQYQQARQDLERQVLDNAQESSGTGAVPGGNARRTALALAIAIPVCAGLLYFLLGNPEAISFSPATGETHNVTSQEVEAMVARLAARLEQSPTDGKGWVLLGRSYMVMQRYQDAAAAYARAAALIKDDASLFADYADVLAMEQGRRIEGKPLQLVEQALRIDPQHWKALAMAGSAAFERKDYKKAIAYWEKLQGNAEPNSDFARSVMANIDEARQLGGIKAGAAPQAAPATAAVAKPGAASVSGTVNLAGALAGKVSPSDTVFIFARAAQGPRMPLAIVRRQVKDLPAAFTLDDSQAMSPETKLSNFAEVVVGARISKSGNATPQSGDLQGLSRPVKLGAGNVDLVIDSTVP